MVRWRRGFGGGRIGGGGGRFGLRGASERASVSGQVGASENKDGEV